VEGSGLDLVQDMDWWQALVNMALNEDGCLLGCCTV
jgi:hypothetical protein